MYDQEIRYIGLEIVGLISFMPSAVVYTNSSNLSTKGYITRTKTGLFINQRRQCFTYLHKAGARKYHLQFRIPPRYRRPAAGIELLIGAAIQPVQVVALPINSRVPSLLYQITFGLFECDTC